MIQILQLLLGGSGAGAGAPPDGPPTGVSQAVQGNGKITVFWTTGDAAALTHLYRRIGGVFVLQADNIPAGDEQVDTGKTSGSFAVAHFKNGQSTVVVAAEGGA